MPLRPHALDDSRGVVVGDSGNDGDAWLDNPGLLAGDLRQRVAKLHACDRG